MIEIVIETLTWIVAIILFYFFGLRSDFRKAILGFLFMQAITWPLGFVTAELELITYPIRFFDGATTSSFTFEYLAFPVVAALYTVYYPRNSSKSKKIAYSFFIVTVLTVAEVILEIFTDNIEYIQWAWYWSWLTMLVALQFSYRCTSWVLKKV